MNKKNPVFFNTVTLSMDFLFFFLMFNEKKRNQNPHDSSILSIFHTKSSTTFHFWVRKEFQLKKAKNQKSQKSQLHILDSGFCERSNEDRR